MAIKQLRVGDNFCYVIYCRSTKKAAIVDPSYDATEALNFISTNNLKLEYIINTHHHSDHTAENQRIKSIYQCQIITSEAGNGNGDKLVADDEELMLGDVTLKFIHTPGHTPDGLCVIVDNQAIITGDTLFIGDCGRCDLLGSSLAQMFHSLKNKIKTLPDSLIVYPGHDYGPKPYDTLGNQKITNKTLLVKSLEEFSKIP